MEKKQRITIQKKTIESNTEKKLNIANKKYNRKKGKRQQYVEKREKGWQYLKR